VDVRIEEFDALPDDEVAAALRACVAIDSWVEALTAGRPYGDAGRLLAAARAQAAAWTSRDVDAALADHPRIGELPTAADAAAAHASREQAGVDPADAELAERLREGNLRYERRFGRIYLVRARGRTGPELLALLEERLGNDPETELGVTKEQLAEIALLRLAELVESEVSV
jgi:2-oxo-4-hydroxy-4-carboxy-5-ureidoimidazoline decarboxylase